MRAAGLTVTGIVIHGVHSYIGGKGQRIIDQTAVMVGEPIILVSKQTNSFNAIITNTDIITRIHVSILY